MRITLVLGNDFLYPYIDERVYKEAKTFRKEGWDVCVVCWARTITNRPWLRANIEMISSAAFPNVALRSPPDTGPSRVLRASVPWPSQ